MNRRDFLKRSSLATMGGLLLTPFGAKANMIAEEFKGKKAKNIIFMVSDGMSVGTMIMADIFLKRKNGKSSNWVGLYEDNLVQRAVMDMASASSIVTDSAAASSSWGGGARVNNGSLNVSPNGKENMPILQKFKKSGKKVGCVTTVPVTHATPAGFSVVSKTRSSQDKIAEIYSDLGFDVMLGGGRKYFDKDVRKDGKDMYQIFENKGYTVVYTDAKNSNNLNKVIDKAKEELAEKIARQVAKGIKPRAIRSMVIGVPNVGKSTFINKLIKKNVANTANKPGVTKKQQWLKLNKDIELLDTPGILMPKFDNQEIGKKLSLIGSIKDDITPLDDVSLYLIELLKENYLENLNNLYKINVNSDDENVFIMEKVAEKRFKKIGGDYDYDSTIKLLIQDFRTQKFGLITLDNYNDLLENEEQNEN